ncbi:catalase [Alkalihalobacillus xiaoxiensis]|uniref:catalase n=2 Tax=Shouchella xiaoxiensis TaxID=766895 RepID=A0ABS2SXY2_9BACI|nr:catalase [Shouchella xiaoxiensis]
MDENKSGWFDLGNSKPLISKPPVRGTTRTEKASASGKKPSNPSNRVQHPHSTTSPSTNSMQHDAQQNRDLTKWVSDEPAELHSQTVGKRGPVLEQDNVLHETLETFVHEKIIERPVHVKGFGAFGYFETLYGMGEYTKLAFLQSPGQQVPVAVRFSLAVSTKGTPDTSRNVRGFSTKFYTDEGIFDLICNHIPVFSVRDAIRFPESIKAFLPSPKNNLIDPDRFWSFVSRAPESMHFVVRLYSDNGTIKSLRHIPGHSVNTYVWRNAEGKRHYIKYRWVPLAGEQYITGKEAAKLAGENPDIAGQDLFQTINGGKTVQYGLYVQVMDPLDANSLPFDPLDDTKVWDEQQYPLHPVGRMVLNQNPDNYMEQVEKIAFSPSNLLDGAELSDDKMLQGRANIYWDSQRRRIGPDFRKVEVNQQKDWTPANLVTSGDGRYVEGELQRSDLAKQDDFAQAGQFYEALSSEGKQHLVENLAQDLESVSADIQSVVFMYLSKCSAELGDRVQRSVR